MNTSLHTKGFGLLYLFLIGPLFLAAQSPIITSINLNQPSAFLEDYAQSGRTFITITSTDARPTYQVRLEITLQAGSETLILGQNPAFSPIINLQRNVPTLLQGADLLPYFSINNLDPAIRNAFLGRGNQLPAGPVTVCVAAYDLNFPGAPPVSNSACAIGMIELFQPPVLVFPLTEQAAPAGRSGGEGAPQAVNFQWIPQHFFTTEYTLEIWEDQLDFGDNFLIDNVPPLVQVSSMTTSYLLTDRDPLLQDQTNYLWRVTARDLTNQRRFINNGHSELGRFSFAAAVASDCYTPAQISAVGGDGISPLVLSWEGPEVAELVGHNISIWSTEGTEELLGVFVALPAHSGETVGFSTEAWSGGFRLSQVFPSLDILNGPLRFELCADCPAEGVQRCHNFTYGQDTEQESPNCPAPDDLLFTLIDQSSGELSWEPAATGLDHTIDLTLISAPANVLSLQTQNQNLRMEGGSPEPGVEPEPEPDTQRSSSVGRFEVLGLLVGATYTANVCAPCPERGWPECRSLTFEVPDLADCTPSLLAEMGAVTPTTATINWWGDADWVAYYSLHLNGDSIQLSGQQDSYSYESLDEDTNYNLELCAYCPGGGSRRCVPLSFSTTSFRCTSEEELAEMVIISALPPAAIRVDWRGLPAEVDLTNWQLEIEALDAPGTSPLHLEIEPGIEEFDGLIAGGAYLIRFCIDCSGETARCLEREIVLPDCAEIGLTDWSVGPTGPDFAQLFWQLPAGILVDSLRLRYRPDVAGLGWLASRPSLSAGEGAFRLESLQPTTDYVAELCIICEEGAQPNCLEVRFQTTTINCSEAEFFALEYACGEPTDIQDFEGVPLVESLAAGDSIWAGDFMVQVTSVDSYGSPWAGTGKTSVPYLNGAEVSVIFEAVEINENCRMVSGSMNVTPPWAELLSDLQETLSDATNDGSNLSNTIDNLSNILGLIEDVAEMAALLQDLMNSIEASGGFDNLPAQVQQQLQEAIDCLSDPLVIDKEVCRDLIEDALDALSGALAELYAADFQVAFLPAEEMLYGYDSLAYPAMDIRDWYVSVPPINGQPYRVAWKSVPLGQSDQILAQRRPAGDLDSVRFVYQGEAEVGLPQASPRPDGVEGQDRLLTVDYASSPTLYAQQITTDSAGDPQTLIAGQLALVEYAEKTLHVVLVPVNGASPAFSLQDPTIKQELQRIYGPAIVQVNLSVDPQPFMVPGLDVIPQQASGLANYPRPLRQIISSYEDQRPELDTDATYYLFLCPQYDGDRAGFMPRQKRFGFLFLNNAPQEAIPFARLMGHELGHGAYHLQHPWQVTDLSEGETDNLMDYTGGAKLHKWQWDLVDDPVGVVGLFESDQGGSSVTLASAEIFEDLVVEFEGREYLSFVSPRANPITLQYNLIESVTFATGGETYITNSFEDREFVPIGSLMRFRLKTVFSPTEYVVCADGLYYSSPSDTGCVNSTGLVLFEEPDIPNEVIRPILTRYANNQGDGIIHYVVSGEGGEDMVNYNSTLPELPPYDYFLPAFFDLSQETPVIVSPQFIEVVTGEDAEYPIGQDLAYLTTAYQALIADPAYNDLSNYTDISSFYLSGIAVLMRSILSQNLPCFEDVSSQVNLLANSTRALLVEISSLSPLGPHGVQSGIANDASWSLTEQLIEAIYESGYYDETGLTQQEIINSIISYIYNDPIVVGFNERIIQMGDDDEAIAQNIIEDLFNSPTPLPACLIDGMVFPTYSSLEFFLSQLFKSAYFGLSFSNEWVPSGNVMVQEEWFLVKFMRKITPEYYLDFIQWLESPIPGTADGNYYWKSLFEGIEDDIFLTSNGRHLLDVILRAYNAVISDPESGDIYAQFQDLTSAITEFDNDEYNLAIPTDPEQFKRLKIIPYNYTGLLGRLRGFDGVSFICRNSPLTFWYCDNLGLGPIVPAVDITDIQAGTDNELLVYQRNKHLFTIVDYEDDLQDTLAPFEPFILDKNSTFADASQLAQTIDDLNNNYTILPAIALYYLQQNANSQTVEDLIFTTVDIATLVWPVGKLSLLGKMLAYFDKISSALGLAAAFYQDNQNINEETRQMLGLASAFFGLVSMTPGGSGIDASLTRHTIPNRINKEFVQSGSVQIIAEKYEAIIDQINLSSTDVGDYPLSIREEVRALIANNRTEYEGTRPGLSYDNIQAAIIKLDALISGGAYQRLIIALNEIGIESTAFADKVFSTLPNQARTDLVDLLTDGSVIPLQARNQLLQAFHTSTVTQGQNGFDLLAAFAIFHRADPSLVAGSIDLERFLTNVVDDAVNYSNVHLGSFISNNTLIAKHYKALNLFPEGTLNDQTADWLEALWLNNEGLEIAGDEANTIFRYNNGGVVNEDSKIAAIVNGEFDLATHNSYGSQTYVHEIRRITEDGQHVIKCKAGNCAIFRCAACFEAGTSVQTPYGAVPIEDLEVGDEVYSMNHDEQKKRVNRISGTIGRQLGKIYRLVVDNDTLSVSEEHPFYIPSLRRYLPVDSLRRGMQVLTLAGTLLTIQQVYAEATPTNVFNLTVEEDHNYFVGEEGVLVHNAFCDYHLGYIGITEPGEYLDVLLDELGDELETFLNVIREIAGRDNFTETSSFFRPFSQLVESGADLDEYRNIIKAWKLLNNTTHPVLKTDSRWIKTIGSWLNDGIEIQLRRRGDVVDLLTSNNQKIGEIRPQEYLLEVSNWADDLPLGTDYLTLRDTRYLNPYGSQEVGSLYVFEPTDNSDITRVFNLNTLDALITEFSDFYTLFSQKGWNWTDHFTQNAQNYIRNLPESDRLALLDAFDDWPSNRSTDVKNTFDLLVQNTTAVGFIDEVTVQIKDQVKSARFINAVDIAISTSGGLPIFIRLKGQYYQAIQPGALESLEAQTQVSQINRSLIELLPQNITGLGGIDETNAASIISDLKRGEYRSAISSAIQFNEDPIRHQELLLIAADYGNLSVDVLNNNISFAQQMGRRNEITRRFLNEVEPILGHGGLDTEEIQAMYHHFQQGGEGRLFAAIDALLPSCNNMDKQKELYLIHAWAKYAAREHAQGVMGNLDFVEEWNIIRTSLSDLIPPVQLGSGGITPAVRQNINSLISQDRILEAIDLALIKNIELGKQKILFNLKGRYTDFQYLELNNALSNIEKNIIANRIITDFQNNL